MITLHAGAGPEALARCSQFARENIPNVTLLGVTVLTSTNQQGLEAVGVKDPIEDQVLRLASWRWTKELVALFVPSRTAATSPSSSSSITLVTPGIRPANADTGDQKRIMTPRQNSQEQTILSLVGLSSPPPILKWPSIRSLKNFQIN